MDKKVRDAWEYIKAELSCYWESLGKDETFKPKSDIARCYSRVYGLFKYHERRATSLIYGVGRKDGNGEFNIWLDSLLSQVDERSGLTDFSYYIFSRRLGHIFKVGKLANFLLSQLNAVHDVTAEHHMIKALIRRRFAWDNRPLVEECLAVVNTARSDEDGSIDIVAPALKLMTQPIDVRLPDGTLQTDDNGEPVRTSLVPETTDMYLRSMQEFYNSERIKMQECTANPGGLHKICVREISWARQCLGVDQSRAENIVNGIFENEIQSNLAVIDDSQSSLEEHCAAYPAPDAIKRLRGIYRLVQDSDEYAIDKCTPQLGIKLGEVFAKRLEEAIETYSKNPSHLDFSDAVGLAFSHFKSIVTKCFRNYGGITTKLHKHGKLALRNFKADETKKQISLERCLALDVDRTITGKNPEKSEADINVRLSRISAVVAFLITDQDSFDNAHIIHLDNRLLSNRTDEKHEKYFLEILREHDAKLDDYSVNRRIKEIEKSKEIVKMLGPLHESVTRPLFVASSAFSTVNQGKYGSAFIPPSGEIRDILDGLQSAFNQHDPKSSICWLNYKGRASLKVVLDSPDGTPVNVTYNMTIAQAALLMFIQERTFAGNPATWTDIAGCWKSGGKDATRSLKENLGDLMNTKRGGKPSVPLIKPSKGKFDHTTTFTLNSEFPMDKTTIDFAFKTRELDEDQDLAAAHVDKLKVCVVRYMKANQRADCATLLAHVKSQAASHLRIPEPSDSQFKKVLNLLLSGAEQYIQRDDEDSRIFVYNA